MKYNKYTWALLATLGFTMAGCAKFDPIPADQLIVGDDAAWSETMSIADFKQTFDLKDSVFSINYIDTESEVIIKGRVTSTDVAGNIYKYMVIQDTQTGEALKVSVDAGSLSGTFPLGQVVAIKCKGLVLGRYADMVQLGIETFNTNYSRIEPGRIPYPYFDARVQCIGTPDTTAIIVQEITIPELLACDSTMYGRLVRIKDVHFTGLGDGGERLSDADKIFAPSTFNGTYNVGYPQARQIADADGNVAYISSSEYARFADLRIPDEDQWGDVVALVSWYKNSPTTEGEIQLTIRTLNDLEGFETGSAPTPTPAIFSETFLNGTLGEFTAYSVTGTQTWRANNQYGATISGYQNGSSHANEDWLISPAIDLSGKASATIVFEHAINFADMANLTNNHTLWVSDNYNSGDPSTATWTQVTIASYASGNSWTFSPSGDCVVPSQYLKAGVRLAFKYMCDDTASSTWEIKNLNVYAE